MRQCASTSQLERKPMTTHGSAPPVTLSAHGGLTIKGLPAPIPLLDPTRPVVPVTDSRNPVSRAMTRPNQRHRRSVILAAIRQLLIEEGYSEVSVRRVAEMSGLVVQTVYNLVGPRDHAIVEAILDYTLHVGRLRPPDAEDPAAMVKSIEWQGQSVSLAPAFTRQVCLIYFTRGRHVFYDYRERQVRNLQAVLLKQQSNGILRPNVNCHELARELMLYSSALFLEWADRQFPLDELIPRLKSGYGHILAAAISPKCGGLDAMLE
jgi:AcrR family transcriptional regulator